MVSVTNVMYIRLVLQNPLIDLISILISTIFDTNVLCKIGKKYFFQESVASCFDQNTSIYHNYCNYFQFEVQSYSQKINLRLLFAINIWSESTFWPYIM